MILIAIKISENHRDLNRLTLTNMNKLCGRPPQYALASLTFLTLKVVSKSCVTWATSVPILVFLVSVLDLRQMYVTDGRQTDVR